MPFSFFGLKFLYWISCAWIHSPGEQNAFLTQKKLHRQDKNKFLHSVLKDQLLHSLASFDSEEYLVQNFFDWTINEHDESPVPFWDRDILTQ